MNAQNCEMTPYTTDRSDFSPLDGTVAGITPLAIDPAKTPNRTRKRPELPGFFSPWQQKSRFGNLAD
ncbi:MAG: hypothetical protein WBC71_03750 [Salaquimonas sp.]